MKESPGQHKSEAQHSNWKAAGSVSHSVKERRENVSPDPESGGQWKPFGRVTLGNRTTALRDKPSSVFSANICSSTICRLSLCAGAVLAFCVLIVGVAVMDQSYSIPLSVMTDHFSDFKSKAQNLSMLVKKSKLRTLCSSKWPTFQVGWPPEGTFGLPVIRAVKAPYILVWENLVEDPPVWLKPFIHNPPSASVPQVLVVEAPQEEDREAWESRKKPILQESSLYPNLIDSDTEILPPPYIPPPLLLQVLQVLSGEQRGNSEPLALQQEQGPAQGTRRRT